MKSAYRTFAALVSLSGLATGCSGYGLERSANAPSAFSQPAAGAAKICVFRPHGLGTSVVAPVSDNGAIVGATEGSSYFCYLAEPGAHRIRTGDAPALSLNAEAQSEYYLAHALHVGKDALIRIKRESALQLSAWCGNRVVTRTPDEVAVMKVGQVARADTSGVPALASKPSSPAARQLVLRAANDTGSPAVVTRQ